MKILLSMNLPYLRSFGGANRSNRSLCEALAARGHQVKVLVPALASPSSITYEQFLQDLEGKGFRHQAKDGYVLFAVNGVEVTAAQEASRLRAFLSQHLRSLNPDWILISSEDPSQNLLASALEYDERRVVYLAHTPQMLPFGPASLYPGEMRTDLIKRAAAIVSISHYVADYVQQWAGRQVFVNHPPHYGKPPFPSYGSCDSGYVLMMNPCAVKGIAIFQALAAALPHIKFAAVPGYGTTHADRAVLDQLPNVTVLNNSPNLDEILCQTRILLMPTLWAEGFGMAAVDAMLRGIPVLASDFGGLREAKLGTDFLIPIQPIEKFQKNLDETLLPVAVVPPQNISQWRAVLESLLSNRDLYTQHSVMAREVSQKFVSSLSCAPLEQFLKELEKNRSAGNHVLAQSQASATSVKGPSSESLEDKIKRLTPEQRAVLMLRMNKRLQQENSRQTIPKASRDRDLPLSFAQQGLWFIHQLEPETTAYNMAFGLNLAGKLDKQALRRSINEIVHRHEILRTTFPTREGVPVQKIADKLELDLAEVNLLGLPEEEREAKVREFARAEADQPFDLVQGPLVRVRLLQWAEQQHVLFLTMNHIVGDGWSIELIVREFSLLYEAYVRRLEPKLEEPPIQYADFAVWQHEWIKGADSRRHMEYWRKQLEGMPTLELPSVDRRGPNDGDAGVVVCTVNKQLTEGLKDLARRENTTLFVCLLTALDVVLSRYSGQRDVGVTTITANRNRAEIENLIGFFVNTLVLRTHVRANSTFLELLREVRTMVLEAYQHQDMPFEKIVEALAPERVRSRVPLAHAMLVLQNVKPARWELSELQVNPISNYHIGSSLLELDLEPLKFDFLLSFQETANGLEGGLSYARDRYDTQQMERLLEHFKRVLEVMTTAADTQIDSISLLTEIEKQQIVVEWNQTQLAYPRMTVASAFTEQVKRAPHAIAVEHEGRRLTYLELDQRANQLAHDLKKLGIGPEMRVGICAQRSLEMVVGLLGILKAGGAYVPLDPSYPSERLEYIIKHAEVRLLLSQGELKRYATESVAHIDVSNVFHKIGLESTEEVFNENLESSLAYVMYTSGSTGLPKGVGVEHRSILRLVKEQNYAVLNNEQVFLQFAPLAFDASTFEIWGCLLNGGRLVVYPPGITSLKELGNAVQRNGVTTLWLTAGLFHQMVEEELPSLKCVTQLLAGGDTLRAFQVRKVLEQFPNMHVINGYGPTENTTFSCCYRMASTQLEDFKNNVPIGRPIINTQVYVVDESMQLLPPGMPGELCVAGVGLARGYLSRPDLTAEKFMPNPFSESEGGRLYRTGDRVRWRPDRTLEFLGRIDQQVKIQGYRIEPGEIEAALREHPEVQDAVVVAQLGPLDEKRLVAYVIPKNVALDLQPDVLREHLRRKLPRYMVPDTYVNLDVFPLTLNGKLDYKALPYPSSAPASAGTNCRETRDAVEAFLKQIWAEVVGTSSFGIRDDFFTIGGNSLKAAVLCTRIEERFGRQVPISLVFDKTTIEQQAAFLRGESLISVPESLVPIQSRGSSRPLFCVHPYFGLAHCYLELSRMLGPDQPFYGLQSRGLESGQTPLPTVPDMASCYLESIRRIQLSGPYRLAGWSMGALIAYEMAQQLVAAGEEVEFLGLLEGWARPFDASSSPNRLMDWSDWVSQEEQEYLIGLAEEELGISEKELCSMTHDERIAWYLQEGKTCEKIPDSVSQDQFRRLLKVIATNKVAISCYQTKPYPGRAILLRAPLLPGDEDETHGWAKLVLGGLEVFEVPGTHDDFMSMPAVARVAEILTSYMHADSVEVLRSAEMTA